MKAVLALSAASGVLAAKVNTFGPNHCVSVFRNEEKGTCVMKTDCGADANLESVEFAFTCQLPNMLQKHSFGNGGFDNQEEFDTNVKCDSCGLPAEVSLSLQKALLKKQEPAAKAEAKVEKKEEKPKVVDKVIVPKDAVSYGPSSCIHTWLQKDAAKPAAKEAAKDAAAAAPAAAASLLEEEPKKEESTDKEGGICQVATTCKGVTAKTFKDYSVGLICLSSEGTPVRHLFGKNSFDNEEHFNTLIRCSSCLGLDEISEAVTLEADIKALSRVVGKIADRVEKIEKTTSAAGFLAHGKAEVVEVKKAEEKAEEKVEEKKAEEKTEDKAEEKTEETTESTSTDADSSSDSDKADDDDDDDA